MEGIYLEASEAHNAIGRYEDLTVRPRLCRSNGLMCNDCTKLDGIIV